MCAGMRWVRRVAVDETATLLHPPLPLVGVSIVMERERQQNDSDSLINGHRMVPHTLTAVCFLASGSDECEPRPAPASVKYEI